MLNYTFTDKEYAKLKYTLAGKHRFNREDYTKAKTEFISKITEQQKERITNDEAAST